MIRRLHQYTINDDEFLLFWKHGQNKPIRLCLAYKAKTIQKQEHHHHNKHYYVTRTWTSLSEQARNCRLSDPIVVLPCFYVLRVTNHNVWSMSWCYQSMYNQCCHSANLKEPDDEFLLYWKTVGLLGQLFRYFAVYCNPPRDGPTQVSN